MDIYIVEGAPSLLMPMGKKTHEEAYLFLTNRGVRVILDTTVKDFDGDTVKLSDNRSIRAMTLIWTAGITANTFDGIPVTSLGLVNVCALTGWRG
ncbi:MULTISPECIES: FAD-dependent oxidoreductase [Mucilaginibacter]|uniref:FAD-dependent oxidoreductase n=1 Tax=Mucilaginibacter TaxID=423349 RepID=UPI001ABFC412|nr:MULTISPECIES: FAD-dependent oxidoreductase [Mucilaginibacter]